MPFEPVAPLSFACRAALVSIKQNAGLVRSMSSCDAHVGRAALRAALEDFDFVRSGDKQEQPFDAQSPGRFQNRLCARTFLEE